LDFGAGASFTWSPITLFSGHTLNAGHFLQPATMAIGHRVMRASRKADEDTLVAVEEHRPMRTENDLERFVEAQDVVYQDVRRELAAGRKATHWMWFVFPQLRGLGRSATARYFGIGSRDEAAAYLQHPVLGARLRECVGLVLAVDGSSAHAIFGSPDDLKVCSSMTLFAAIAPSEPLFRRALDKYFGGAPDPATSEILRSEAE
jgi:uncharacterized protein (DUF1810 family)